MHRRSSDAKGWVCAAANVFQNVTLCATVLPVEREELERTLLRVPVPSTPFEHLAVRCFMCDSLMAVISHELVNRSPTTVHDVFSFIASVRLIPNPVPRFAQLLKSICLAPSNENDSLANKLSTRLETQYGLRVTARGIAKEYQMSRAQLERMCSRSFGMPFHRYLTGVRVRHGLKLVTNGMKVEAAAMSVGYKSKKDFYRAVRLLTGKTPGEWRRKDS